MWQLLVGIPWLISLLFALPASAIHAEEAGVVDWHKSLIGDTLTDNPSLAPVFHRVGEANESTKSYILTATASNVLAALHPENGSVAWRYLFEENDPVIMFKKHKHSVATLSGAAGDTFRLFDVRTGELVLERHLSESSAERMFNPASTGVTIAFDSSRHPSVYALTGGHTVRRLVTSTGGKVQWTWTAVDQGSLVIYSSVVPTPSAVYVIGLAKSFASYTLHVTALSPESGAVLAEADVKSSIIGVGPASFLVLNRKGKDEEIKDEDDATRVVWLEGGVIRSIALTPELKDKPVPVKGAVYEKIIDAGLCEHGMFVALKEDGSGRVIKLNQEEKGLKVIWEFADSAKAAHYTDSIYTGGLDKDGYPYVARVFWSHAYKAASAHILAPHLADGKGLVTGFTFPFETAAHGIIAHVAVDAANPEEFRVVARLVLSTTTGAVQLWQQDQVQWTREEGLADIRVAEFVELPEQNSGLVPGAAEESESFFGRLQRQIREARGFPQYVVRFASRFVSGSGALPASPVVPAAENTEPGALVRDAFGFRKVLVVATGKGKVYGLDSASGEIIWSRVFGLGWAAKVGGRITPAKIFTIRAVGDVDDQRPQVVLVTVRNANNGLVDTVLFHVDALTGEDIAHTEASQGGLLEGVDTIAGALVDAFIVRNRASKYILLFDEFLQTYIYPDTSAATTSFRKHIPSLHIPLRTQTGLTGHRLSNKEEFTGRHIAQAEWSLALAPNEAVVDLITRPVEPVASLGKVLGDRSTLYKYLNPNMAVVLTATAAQAPNADAPAPASTEMKSCGLYVVDTAKGTILYNVVLPAVHGACDVKAAFAENWLVYIYYDPEVAPEQAKGYEVVSVEFYEGDKPDDKTSSSDLSSYANEVTNITTYEQAFVFPRGITALATTSTKFGISSKELIVAGDNNAILAIPRRFLDPRRPKRKPTTQEQEEWLIQYDPLIPDDPKRVLSHVYQVARVRKIITSPALLESTSLVFAYGLDLFATRVAPSNTFDVLSENFNKVQLMVTIAALSVAILITKPMVRRKRLRERWYN